ncbi:hypothetical protein STEG23_012558 [Scotinomys teguina]
MEAVAYQRQREQTVTTVQDKNPEKTSSTRSWMAAFKSTMAWGHLQCKKKGRQSYGSGKENVSRKCSSNSSEPESGDFTADGLDQLTLCSQSLGFGTPAAPVQGHRSQFCPPGLMAWQAFQPPNNLALSLRCRRRFQEATQKESILSGSNVRRKVSIDSFVHFST